MSLKRHLTRVFAFRWQLPLAFVALALAGYAVSTIEPEQTPVPFDALVADVVALQQAGAYPEAANAAANLLKHEPPFNERQQRKLHDLLAQVLFEQEFARKRPHLPNARLLLEHHDQASALGRPLTANGALRAGFAHQWLGRVKPAIASFNQVLAADPTPEQRRLARRGLVTLLAGDPDRAAERDDHIRALLNEPGLATDYRWWALRTAIRDALHAGEINLAQKLLRDHGEPFQHTDLQGYHDYLQALVWTYAGELDRVAPTIARILDWLNTTARFNTAMDAAGFLPALTATLAGRYELRDYRPQHALQHFDRALQMERYGEILADAGYGRIEALVQLERHAAARDALRDTAARLQANPAVWTNAGPRYRDLGRRLVNQRLDRADFANAIAYLQATLAMVAQNDHESRLELLELLGDTYVRACKDAATDADAVSLQRKAADAFASAANLAADEEQRHADLLWQAANAYTAGRELDAARQAWETFISRRAFDLRVPRALLALGEVHVSARDLNAAIDVFERLANDYPALVEAAQARLEAAHARIELGGVHFPDAERALLTLLESDTVTPEAQVFRDALIALCDLYYEQSRYAEAISRMEDFLIFFPDDSQRFRVQFLLADAYRRSAYALREDAGARADVRRAEVSRERFQRASKLFRTFAEQIGKLDHGTETGPIYERLALFYHGDCLFELNDPQSLREALSTYRQAAARYQNLPAALTAQIQIANIHLRLGERTEAARALERARWILQSIPDQAFDKDVAGRDRAYWQHYLSTVRASHLFRDVLMSSQ